MLAYVWWGPTHEHGDPLCAELQATENKKSASKLRKTAGLWGKHEGAYVKDCDDGGSSFTKI